MDSTGFLLRHRGASLDTTPVRNGPTWALVKGEIRTVSIVPEQRVRAHASAPSQVVILTECAELAALGVDYCR